MRLADTVIDQATTHDWTPMIPLFRQASSVAKEVPVYVLLYVSSTHFTPRMIKHFLYGKA
jgi:hypothetical protein